MSVPSHWFSITKSADRTPDQTLEKENVEMGRKEASKKDLANFLGDCYSFLLKKKKKNHTTSHQEMCLEGV